MIEFFSVTKRYPGGQIGLDDVTLRIGRGQMVFLTGPSGAGKTTFLKLIYCEEVPSTGNILVNGRNVSSLPRGKVPFLRRTIGVVFQSFRLIPRKTVFENVCYLPRILGLSVKEQKKLAYETLRQVGLAHRMNAFPLQLSGGEQQRVAIARALINRPEILLADEPTGNLDPGLSDEILKLLLEINRLGTTVIFATHDRELIDRVGGRVLTLENGKLGQDQVLAGELNGSESESESEPEGDSVAADEVATAEVAKDEGDEEMSADVSPDSAGDAIAADSRSVDRQGEMEEAEEEASSGDGGSSDSPQEEIEATESQAERAEGDVSCEDSKKESEGDAL